MASGRLSVEVRDLKARLRRYGFVLVRQVGSHEQWRCSRTGKAVTLAVHGTTIRGDQVRNIYEQAGWAWRVTNDKRRKLKKKSAEAPEMAAASGAPIVGRDPISRTAARILGGETANRAGKSEGLNLSICYAIAHGTHPDLPKPTAERLRDLWARRKQTNASKRARLGVDTIGHLVDAIVRGEPVTQAAARLGINEKSAFRIATGKHRSLTDDQRIMLMDRPSQTRRSTPLQLQSAAALRLELERVQALLAAEQKLTAVLRHSLAAITAADRPRPAAPLPTPASASGCMHPSLLRRIEAAIDRRLADQPGASRDVRRFIRNDTIGFFVMSGKSRCEACDRAMDERALRRAVWPF